MKSAQGYAVRIEHIMCEVFDCKRFDIGGLVNSDYIRLYPFTAMLSTLTYLLGTKSIGCVEIVSRFFKNYSFLDKLSIDEILSFENAPKEINEEKFNDGEEIINSVIDAFSADCKLLK